MNENFEFNENDQADLSTITADILEGAEDAKGRSPYNMLHVECCIFGITHTLYLLEIRGNFELLQLSEEDLDLTTSEKHVDIEGPKG